MNVTGYRVQCLNCVLGGEPASEAYARSVAREHSRQRVIGARLPQSHLMEVWARTDEGEFLLAVYGSGKRVKV